ncbi:hypothetical protein GCM10011364_00550 [Mangrovimonas yunxiaonensis]|nr:hypothetical protein GCM10011364_00550 [Mangrovimonas yunxiaonensis]
MYAFTSLPFVNLTLATLRIAEFGFFGVVVYTRVQTPRLCGHESKAADLLFLVILALPFRTNCEIVGIYFYIKLFKPSLLRAAKVEIKINFSNVITLIFKQLKKLTIPLYIIFAICVSFTKPIKRKRV